MNNVTSISDKKLQQIKDRGDKAQRKTVEGILDFAQCMVELYESCETISGGSTFTAIASEWWGFSFQTCCKWRAIGQSELSPTGRKLLPPSWRTIYEISKLTTQQYDKALSEGIIHPNMTRDDLMTFKRPTIVKKKPRAGAVDTAGAQRVKQVLNGDTDLPLNGHTARARKIVEASPELAERVASGEISVNHAERQADIIRIKEAEAVETPIEDIQAVAEEIQAIVPPHLISGLTQHEQNWFRQDYQELRNLMDAVTKSTSKKVLTAFFKLIKYQTSMMQKAQRETMPAAIVAKEEALAKREADLEKRIKLTRNLKQTISKSDIRLIQNCLHPDRAPDDKKERFSKAFEAFTAAL